MHLVSISESRCFSFQGKSLNPLSVWLRIVSISESRCFSFQARERVKHDVALIRGFNLGIEMLFVSRFLEFRSASVEFRRFNLGIEMLFVSSSTSPLVPFARLYCVFQSRNRDAFRFKCSTSLPVVCIYAAFQSRNRDAFRFKAMIQERSPQVHHVSISESRCFSFQVNSDKILPSRFSEFQSRNRDAFRFKFNITFGTVRTVVLRVSISESRCFSFQVLNFLAGRVHIRRVSISESRCFSFQGHDSRAIAPSSSCFNLGIEMLFVSSEHATPIAIGYPKKVSISESRCFSFQAFRY